MTDVIPLQPEVTDNATPKPRNILLIGRTGGGKSTLANVLTNSEEFIESSGSVSETRSVQSQTFRIEMDNEGRQMVEYRIIDTIGIGDTKLSPQAVLYRLAEVSSLVAGGINQVFFVTSSRFTKEEAKAYDLLSSIIFDKEVIGYTTIVRTNFPEFEDEEACERDRHALRAEKSDYERIVNSVKKILYVNNPPVKYGSEVFRNEAKRMRDESSKRLITYLGTCQAIYKPSTLETLDERIKDYMTDEEKLWKKLEQTEKERIEQAEQFRKELREAEERRIKEMREAEQRRVREMEALRVQQEQARQAEAARYAEQMRQQQARHDEQMRRNREEMERRDRRAQEQMERQLERLRLQEERERSRPRCDYCPNTLPATYWLRTDLGDGRKFCSRQCCDNFYRR
jgi:AIG1 family